MKVIEVDQFTSTGNLREQPFDEVTLGGIEGGDSEAAKVIFGGRFNVREVSETQNPSIGYVWFKKGENGKPELYKSNYDTSD
jgi:hypothetical protein